MNYEVVKQWNDMDFGGTGVVGTINIPVHELIEKFGQPTQVNGPRIQMRWLIKFENGICATIFNDKKNKPGEWCVGGLGHYDKNTKENYAFKAVNELLSA